MNRFALTRCGTD